jgi:hypothetical protein
MADVAPNQTIYVNNLPEKIGKEGGAHLSGATERCLLHALSRNDLGDEMGFLL